MEQREQGRYSRSRYGSGGRSRASSGRYYDSFYEDMLIPEEGPISNAGQSADEPSGEPVKNSEDRSDDELASRPAEGTDEPAVSSRDSDYSDPEFADGDAASTSEGADRVARAYSRKSAEDRAAASAQKKRPSFKLGRIGRIVAVVVAAVALVGAGVAISFVSGIAGNLHAGVNDDLRAALAHTDMANETFYMLLLGTDGSAERDKDPTYGGGYRSDSMMLARIDAVNKKATLLSIGRDIMVDLGGDMGEQKINAAFAYGGPALAVKTVSQFAGVPISHYAQVDFDGFAAMVDALGGVEVDVPMAIVNDYDAGGSVPGGQQTLDGAQALILCRARNSYADISAHPDEMRAANQRLVLSAIARKLLDSDIATIASTVRAMSSYVTTDLELTDIIGLAQVMKGLNPDTDIYTGSVPSTSKYIDDIWYEFVDKDAWKKIMDRVDAGEPPVEEAVVDEATGTVLATAGAGATSTADKQAVVTVKNGTSISGLAANLRTKLKDAGFVNAVVGDIAAGYKYPDTLVIYDEPGRAREAAEIVSVMGQGKAMQNDGSYLLVETDFLVVIGDDWDTSK